MMTSAGIRAFRVRSCRIRTDLALAGGKTVPIFLFSIGLGIFGLSNARVEAINTHIRMIARRASGFHSPEALISLAMLKLDGLCPPLPGRVTVT
jgi:hypothetical protein